MVGTAHDGSREETCPQSDSNRHLADFKSAASANWAMGAIDHLVLLGAPANTNSDIPPRAAPLVYNQAHTRRRHTSCVTLKLSGM